MKTIVLNISLWKTSSMATSHHTSPGFRYTTKLAGLLVLINLLFSPVYADVGLFGNLTYRDNQDQDFKSNPFIISLDLYAAEEFSDRWSGLFEFVGEKSKGHSEAHIERLSIKYKASEFLQISAGRFHIPMGHWNTYYHHGRQLYDTAERPFFLDFEDHGDNAVLPIHSSGIRINGVWEKKKGSFGYDFLLGNAHRIDSTKTIHHGGHDAPRLVQHDKLDSQLSRTFRATYKSIDNKLAIGIFGRDHTILESGQFSSGAVTEKDKKLFKQNFYGVDLRLLKSDWEFIAEYYTIRNKVQFGDKKQYRSTAYYAQLAYQFLPRFKGVYRYARLNFHDDDPFYYLLASRNEAHHVFTLRYDINLNHTIKLEYDLVDSKSSRFNGADNYRLQWAFHFY